jgi:hypothetical protein
VALSLWKMPLILDFGRAGAILIEVFAHALFGFSPGDLGLCARKDDIPNLIGIPVSLLGNRHAAGSD